MSIAQAQRDMRRGYCSGGAGILASALAWSVAAGFAIAGPITTAIWALLVGGMLIHPVAVLLCRMFGASGAHAKGNPMGMLAGASTFWLVFCLPVVYLLALQEPGWFFPAMLLVIGGRYLVFATMFGMRLYWVLGLGLAAAGFALAYLAAPAPVSAVVGAALEMGFAVACLVMHRREVRAGDATRDRALGGLA